MPKSKSKSKYPKEIYVHYTSNDEDDSDTIVLRDTSAFSSDDWKGETVAIYKLVRVAKVKTKVELV
jgi:hypothetical protein